MRKIHVFATLILLSCTFISPVITYESDDRRNVLPTILPQVISYRQSSTAIAQIYIEHSSVSDLVVDLGVSDPNQPRWSINVWNRRSSANNLNLTVDISGATEYLPPSEENRWFLRVFDAVSGNQGQIKKFTITRDNQSFDSMSIPVAIYDSKASYSYIPGVLLELAISRRISIRDFPETENYTFPEVSWELLSKVLWAGYGLSSWGRTAPNICGNYPLKIYVCNETAVYTYDPEKQSLSVWKYGDYRFSNEPWPGFPYPGIGAHPAPIELFITLDTNQFSDINIAAMEAGAAIQNVYLEANVLGLGTDCVGGVNKTLAHDILGLPNNEVILYNMPLGYPTTDAFYNFTCVQPPGSVELPQVTESSVFLDSALKEGRTSHEWSDTSLTSQDTSQILWAAYGRSYLMDMRPSFWTYQYQHRTVPSAGYCLTIYMVNSTGIYVYDPWSHRILMTSAGDRRAEIAQSTEGHWAASAPMMLLTILNTSQMGEGRLDWAYTEIGCVTQNVRLESTAWDLTADWAKVVNETAIKTILAITGQVDLHPVTIMTVGHPSLQGDVNDDGTVDIFDAIILSSAFNSVPDSPRWNPNADINKDGIVDIYDAIILARNFGGI